MGLDMVEILIEIEDKFEIYIPEYELAEVPTVGELHDYIMRKIGEKLAPDTCVNMVIALRLRHALMEVTRKPRQEIQLDTEMDLLLPLNARRTLWKDLKKRADIPLPMLRWPGWCKCTFWALTTMPLWFGSLYFSFPVFESLFWGLVLACLFVAGGAAWLLERWARIFPTNCRLLKDTVTAISKKYGKTFVHSSDRPSTSEETWNTLREIIAKVAGVKPERITRETHPYKDLGLE